MLRNLGLLALWATSILAIPQKEGEQYTGTAGNSTIAGNPSGPDSNGKYEISGPGIRALFIPYGASISNLFINDSSGIERDIVTGFDNASYYEIDRQHGHFGGVPGRYANRIKNSTFTVDGETYHVTPNEHPTEEYPEGVNQLHGGPNGWDWRNWTVVAHTANSITFSLTDPDGEMGFPGEVVSYVTYTLGNMTWDFKMVALSTTKVTPIMLSSHVGPLSIPHLLSYLPWSSSNGKTGILEPRRIPKQRNRNRLQPFHLATLRRPTGRRRFHLNPQRQHPLQCSALSERFLVLAQTAGS
jgi:aldose 1-epimerase